MTGGEEKVKKDRDPIFMVCFVILLLASCAVIGGFVYSEYLEKDNTLANNGDTVVVNYTGCFYDFYGEEHAVVFDTSYSSIANNKDIAKSNSFTSKDSYSTLSFTIGGTTVLSMFGDSVVGHKVGETFTVKIPAGNGYVAQDDFTTVSTSNGVTISSSEIMTEKQFSTAYPDATYNNMFESKYGWNAIASYNSTNNTVTVQYYPTAGQTYMCSDSDFGKVSLSVTSVSGSEIVFNYIVRDYVTTGSVDASGNREIEMILVDFGTSSFYITAITDSGSGVANSFTYKTVGEKYNVDLYFTITLESIK